MNLQLTFSSYQKPLAVAAFLLCGISIIASVLLWISVPTEIFGKWLAGATAIALEICKFAFLPLALIMWKREQHGWSITLGSIGFILLIVSVSATIGFVQNANQQQQTEAQQSTIRYQTNLQQLDSLNKQVDQYHLLIKTDSDNGFRDRGYKGLNKLDELETQRTALVKEMSIPEKATQGEMNALTGSIAKQLDMDADKLQLTFFTSLAVLVDVSAIISLSFLSMHTKTTRELTTKSTTKDKTNNNKETFVDKRELDIKTIRTIHKPTSKQPPSKHQQIKQKLLTGVYGEQPVVRRVMESESVQHKVVKTIFDELINEESLLKEGRRYSLTNYQPEAIA